MYYGSPPEHVLMPEELCRSGIMSESKLSEGDWSKLAFTTSVVALDVTKKHDCLAAIAVVFRC
jgi:hypothetical protein